MDFFAQESLKVPTCLISFCSMKGSSSWLVVRIHGLAISTNVRVESAVKG